MNTLATHRKGLGGMVAGHAGTVNPVRLVDTARNLATSAHHGQIDQGGNPYITHPHAVALGVVKAGGDRYQVAVAWLHDVVEDTPVTLDDLRGFGFPDRVVDAIDAITHRKGESRDDYYKRVAANPDALAVKYADLAHNTHPYRMSLLDQDVRDRLITKYTHAYNVLTSLAPGTTPHVRHI